MKPQFKIQKIGSDKGEIETIVACTIHDGNYRKLFNDSDSQEMTDEIYDLITNLFMKAVTTDALDLLDVPSRPPKNADLRLKLIKLKLKAEQYKNLKKRMKFLKKIMGIQSMQAAFSRHINYKLKEKLL